MGPGLNKYLKIPKTAVLCLLYRWLCKYIIHTQVYNLCEIERGILGMLLRAPACRSSERRAAARIEIVRGNAQITITCSLIQRDTSRSFLMVLEIELFNGFHMFDGFIDAKTCTIVWTSSPKVIC